MLEQVPRRMTREVRIGAVTIGGDHPIAVQSMTNTETAEVEATVEQIHGLEEAGCELVRATCNSTDAVRAFPEIKKRIRLPLIADIHFRARLAIKVMEAGADKVRVNPGNLGGLKRLEEVVRAARDHGLPLRLGVNSGSLDRKLLRKYGYPCPEALVESAMQFVKACEDWGFTDLVVSLKATDVSTTVRCCRMFAEQTDYPLHLGVTEAGLKPYGALKSAVGIGSLLLDGIGDTIRVSLTDAPVEELPVAFDILKATGRRLVTPELISCPTCGRLELDLQKVVKLVREKLKDMRIPLRIAILGCVVNGPGEAREADLGIAGGRGEGILFRKGVELRRVPEEELVEALMAEIEQLEEAERTEGEEGREGVKS